jgi:hypothetical protein
MQLNRLMVDQVQKIHTDIGLMGVIGCYDALSLAHIRVLGPSMTRFSMAPLQSPTMTTRVGLILLSVGGLQCWHLVTTGSFVDC